jgi:hypothetical protein
MDKGLVILALVGLTSLVACSIVAAKVGMSVADLRLAMERACEVIGLAVAFLAANIATWSTFVLATRALTHYSPSFYVLADESLLVLSGLQGLVFAHWLRGVRVTGCCP